MGCDCLDPLEVTTDSLEVEKVFSADGVFEIGRITRKSSHVVQELITNADTFVATFPIDLEVRLKAVLLCSVFFLSFALRFHSFMTPSFQPRSKSNVILVNAGLASRTSTLFIRDGN
ncbi:unnamed protein product [Echinostoma caproni]|uniref:Phospholipid scramblase n=1 Tax=Echinostoma caproni TaxID=27848 RepID=A0A183AEC0_9TREM|nr:unnamed protein product [Echinostoma caproni]